MVDEFEVEPVFEERTYERHQFKLMIDGRKYKGDYHGEEIHWLNPHPKQNMEESHLKAVEAKVHDLLGEHGVRDETHEMEVEPMLNNSAQQLHVFKLKIQGNEYKGTFRDGEIVWFNPKPERKLKEEHVERVEEKIHKKMKKHTD